MVPRFNPPLHTADADADCCRLRSGSSLSQSSESTATPSSCSPTPPGEEARQISNGTTLPTPRSTSSTSEVGCPSRRPKCTPTLTSQTCLSAELPAAKTTDPYLGLLYAMEDYAVSVRHAVECGWTGGG